MFTIIFAKIADFFTKQWGVIASVGAGLLVLASVKRYIEHNAVTRAQYAELTDAMNRIKQMRDFQSEFKKNLNSLDRDALLAVMREKGELRDASQQ